MNLNIETSETIRNNYFHFSCMVFMLASFFCLWFNVPMGPVDIASFSCPGVALLPFVDEKRLLSCLGKVYPDLTEEEGE